MKLMVGHTTKWDEPYGVIEDVQDYNLDRSWLPQACSMRLTS
jgi:hypothetical protein